MRIGIIYDYMYPFNIGGVETRNYSLAKRLARDGHDVHLFGTRQWVGGDLKLEGVHFRGIGPNKVFSGRRKALDPAAFSLRLYTTLRRERFDLIDCAAFPYFPLMACKAYCGRRVPLLVTWHEFWGRYWWSHGPVKGAAGRMAESLALLSRHNLAVSGHVMQNLVENGMHPEKVSVISNWIEKAAIDSAKPVSSRYDVVYAGRFMPHKNLELALRVIRLARRTRPGIRALFLGDGPQTISLLRLRSALGLEGNVDILSHVPKQVQLYSYMKSGRLFMLLSELEGFSITAVEAMACGLPLVTVDAQNNAAKDLVEEGKNGIVCKPDEVSLASRVTGLLADGKKLRRMSQHALEYSRKYDIEQVYPQIIQMYEKIR